MKKKYSEHDPKCPKCGQMMVNPNPDSGAFERDLWFCEDCDSEALAEFEQFMDEENQLHAEESGSEVYF